jgi:hypothetical protein
MNVVNRVVMVILLLVAMALCSLLLMVPVPVLEVIEQQSVLLAQAFDRWSGNGLFLWGIPLALLVDMLLFLLIVLEVRRPSRRAIRVEKAAGGEVLVSITSIADRVKYESNRLPGVLQTKPRVSGKRSGVVVELDVETAAGVSVPEQAGQIVEVTRRAVEEDMGLKLARPPKVNLRVVPFPKAEAVPVEPKVTPPMAEPEPPQVVEPKPAVPATEPEPVSFAEPQAWAPVEPAVDSESEEDELPDLPVDFGPFGEGE